MKRLLFVLIVLLLSQTAVAQNSRAHRVKVYGTVGGVYTTDRHLMDPNIDWEKRTYTFRNCIPNETIPLWGYVYVETDPKKRVDFEVRMVRDKTSWADFHICKVKGSPCEQDLWHFVNDRKKANFTIRFVEKDELFSVRFISMKEWKEMHPPYTHGASAPATRVINLDKLPVIDHHWKQYPNTDTKKYPIDSATGMMIIKRSW